MCNLFSFSHLRSSYVMAIGLALSATLSGACNGGRVGGIADTDPNDPNDPNDPDDPDPTTPPPAPTGLEARAGDEQVVLWWTQVEGATGYRLQRATVTGGPYTEVAVPARASHVDIGLTNGTTYYYVVSAQNAIGEGPLSAEVATTPAEGLDSNATSALGYNMDFPGEWTGLSPFLDLIKNGRICEADPIDQLQLDEHGWPLTLAHRDNPSVSFDNTTLYFATGDLRVDYGQTFVVTWEGTGDISIFNSENLQKDLAARRATFELQPGTSALQIIESDPTDHLRNVRIVRADREALLDAGEIFDPDMLDYLKPFGSIRFMDWMGSNQNGHCSGGSADGASCYHDSDTDACADGGGRCVTAGIWAERATADQTSYLSQYLDNEHPELGTKRDGYAVEVMVALANRTGADPHFNIPALYEDDYVRGFAEYVRDNLAPNLRASVEYSNEVWNWGFPQAGYANYEGRALWPDVGSAWVQFMASRSRNMCGIWKDVFRDERHRIRCLISPQTGWQGLAPEVLDCPDWVALGDDAWTAEYGGTECYRTADAIAITGYFHGCLQCSDAVIEEWIDTLGYDAAIDRAFLQLEHGGDPDVLHCGETQLCENNLEDTISAYTYYQGLAAERGLEIYVYEGGTHFDHSENQTVIDFLVEMTRDERMRDLYIRNFEGFRDAGGTIFNMWGWIAQHDAWANAESVLDHTHPKYRAAVDFVSASPCWWPNCDRTERAALFSPR